jgi:hypothetical protein
MGRSIRNALERFLARVNKTDTCWLWLLSLDGHGYGQFSIGGRQVKAHRWAYEHFVGLIPQGYELDHLCRVRHCCNPAHLEATTHRTNVLRGSGIAAKQALLIRCGRCGGDYTLDKRGRRVCLLCQAIRARARYVRSRTQRTSSS